MLKVGDLLELADGNIYVVTEAGKHLATVEPYSVFGHSLPVINGRHQPLNKYRVGDTIPNVYNRDVEVLSVGYHMGSVTYQVKSADGVINTTWTPPNGFNMRDSGSTVYKADAGKSKPSLVFDSFPNALQDVVDVATFGAQKYEENSWSKVPDGPKRYKEAAYRHRMARAKGELIDAESGLPHIAHEIWNLLCIQELTKGKTNAE